MPAPFSRAMVRMLLPAARGSNRSDLGCVIRDGCRPPKSRVPSAFCPRRASHDTFPDHGAFKLGKHAKHLKHRLAGRVDPLLMQIQIDVLGVNILQHLHKVRRRAAQPIN